MTCTGPTNRQGKCSLHGRDVYVFIIVKSAQRRRLYKFLYCIQIL
uniref:Uncharacterized protein n=1 Tax=Anguilla anguilla TaxID=7936 RepID=A0A0E9Q9U8_ANGAN